MSHGSRIGGVHGVLVHGVSALNIGACGAEACDVHRILV
jgi:hypothetical protein